MPRRRLEELGKTTDAAAHSGVDAKRYPRPLLERLAKYNQIVTRAGESGQPTISSATLAQFLGVDSTVVRKDMAAVGITGRPKVGYPIPLILSRLDAVLGLSDRNDAILIGCGSLGSAIVRYSGFTTYGLRIAAVFDIDPEKVGKTIGHHLILPMEKCKRAIEVFRPKIAILAAPAPVAQELAQWLVAHGIVAIWNFAPIHLRMPDNIAVRNEDLGLGLAQLLHHLNQKRKEQDSADA